MSMLIGCGAIANRFIDYSLQSKYLLFAGSVNDSAISDINSIRDEELEVKKALTEYPDNTFVYFSSCSIIDADVSHTPYVQHKIRMEKLIMSSAKSFLIFRLPQIFALSDSKSSLINYLVDSINNNKNFELWADSLKNIIDIDDVYDIVRYILENNCFINKVINVASPYQMPVSELVHEVEIFLGKTADFTLVNKGSGLIVDITEVLPIIDGFNIDFSDGYIQSSLNKYFSHLNIGRKLISIIVPTYNEENGIDEFYRRLKNVLLNLSIRFDHEIIFVNDFSTDNTLSRLKIIAKNDNSVKLINFSRNFGNQIGITAGIDFSVGDIAVVIDDDLQDPPEIIINLIAKWDKGYKVVYGIRPKRKGGSWFFKTTAKIYYRVIGALSDTEIPNDTGDFRLIDRVVVECLKKIKEENRYYRGLVAWVGFSQIGVVYERDKRYAGVSTFSLKKYINFALNGLTSFTEKPLYFSSLAGLFITAISFALALALVINKIIDPSVSIRGWTSLIVVVLFFGGIQLLSIGVLGIYISKIYREVKGRPLYIVESTRNIEKNNE